MNHQNSFDLNSIKNMSVDNLMKKCKCYVEQYLSKNASIQFDKAYHNSDYEEVQKILKKTLKKVKANIKYSDLINAQRIIKRFFEDLSGNKNKNERSRRDNMDISGVMIAFIVIIVAISVISVIRTAICLKKNNKNVGEILSHGSYKSKNVNHYTEKDRDMIELIHELSEVYRKTDEYMKN